VDAVVVEKDGAPRLPDLLAVKHAVGTHDARVEGHAGVGNADLRELQHGGTALGQRLVKLDAGFPGGGLVLVAEFVRGLHGGVRCERIKKEWDVEAGAPALPGREIKPATAGSAGPWP
jgi:hypothetical protein